MKTDNKADAVYIYLSEKPYARGRDLDDNRRIDYSDDGTPIGVELLNVSQGVDISDLPKQREIGKILEGLGLRIFA
ncbi:MAG: DUF2283 domain-containing protein [Dehalococcoidia bacterium]